MPDRQSRKSNKSVETTLKPASASESTVEESSRGEGRLQDALRSLGGLAYFLRDVDVTNLSAGGGELVKLDEVWNSNLGEDQVQRFNLVIAFPRGLSVDFIDAGLLKTFISRSEPASLPARGRAAFDASHSGVTVSVRELRNQTAGVVERAAAGEDVIITSRGKPAARLVALDPRPVFMPAADFRRRLTQADPELSDLLVDLAPDTTDDLPWP